MVSGAVVNVVHLLSNRPLSLEKFSVTFRPTQPTRRYDRPSQIHYYERSSSVGLRSMYIFRWHRTAT